MIYQHAFAGMSRQSRRSRESFHRRRQENCGEMPSHCRYVEARSKLMKSYAISLRSLPVPLWSIFRTQPGIYNISAEVDQILFEIFRLKFPMTLATVPPIIRLFWKKCNMYHELVDYIVINFVRTTAYDDTCCKLTPPKNHYRLL